MKSCEVTFLLTSLSEGGVGRGVFLCGRNRKTGVTRETFNFQFVFFVCSTGNAVFFGPFEKIFSFSWAKTLEKRMKKANFAFD